jgi:hypothetical protein
MCAAASADRLVACCAPTNVLPIRRHNVDARFDKMPARRCDPQFDAPIRIVFGSKDDYFIAIAIL